MKLSKSHVLLGALVPFASAFPAGMMEEVQRNPELAARAVEILKRQSGADAATAIFEPIPSFDAASQLIDVSGNHTWVAPTASDIRGPCPGEYPMCHFRHASHTDCSLDVGLNAFANHGYAF